MHNSAKRVSLSRKITNIPRQASEAQRYLTMYQKVVKLSSGVKESKAIKVSKSVTARISTHQQLAKY